MFSRKCWDIILATNIDVDILNFKKLLTLIKYHKIDLVVVGPEEPLVNGVVDFLKKHKIKVFGPINMPLN